MEIDELVEIVETMVLQHDYPGFDVRSLRLGLPQRVNRAPVKLFVAALARSEVCVRLAALRWFWERPGVAGRHAAAIAGLLEDPDEWVRCEAARTLGRVAGLDETTALALAAALKDTDAAVRKAACRSLGKLPVASDEVIGALRQAAGDEDIEVRWKALKALRQLAGHRASQTL